MNINPETHPEFLQGVKQFNNHDFFDAHDSFEAVWHEIHGPAKEGYQGIVQLAIGYYHFCFGNLKGAENMLKKGLAKLEKKGSYISQINVDEIINSTRMCLSKLYKIKNCEEKLESFNIDNIPKIVFIK